MPTLLIEDDHQSGRFDATKRERLAMNHQIAQTSVVALITEYHGLGFAINGWGEEGDETRLVWDRDFWNVKDRGAVRIMTGPWKRGANERDDLILPWVLLSSEEYPEFTLLRGGGHTPAHPDDPDQARANEKVFAGLAPGFREIVGDHKPKQTSLSFDTNRQLTVARNVEFINKSVKPLGLHLLVPPGATRKPGHRIDAFVVSRGKDEQNMLNWIDGYDHRGIRRERKTRVAA